MHSGRCDVQSRPGSWAGRGRVAQVAQRAGLSRNREDTREATERSSRLSCTRTRSWSAPIVNSSSYLPRASRTSTPSGVSRIRSAAVRAATHEKLRDPKAAPAAAADTAAADLSGVRGRCSPPHAANAGVQPRYRSAPRTASPFIAAIASGVSGTTNSGR